MKYLIFFIFFLLPDIIHSQDSLKILDFSNERMRKQIIENRNYNLKDLTEILTAYEKNENIESINSLFKSIYTTDPNILDLDFLQDFVLFSFQYKKYFDSNLFENFEKFYETLRIRLGTFLVNHQKILLNTGKMHFYNQEQEQGYACLAEVIKINSSRFRENDYLKSNFNSYQSSTVRSYQLAHTAFLLFISELPVKDTRFKMFATHNRYVGFRFENKYQAFKIINRKLNEAGYLPLEIPDPYGLERSDTKKDDEKQKKYSTKDEWVKKQ